MKFVCSSILTLMLGMPVLNAQDLALISKEQSSMIIDVNTASSETSEYPTPSKNMEKKWGYVDATGQYVIEPEYDYAYEFTNGFALVFVDEKYGYIRKDGTRVFNPIFDEAYPINDEGRTIVRAGRVTFVLDMKDMVLTVW